MISLYQNCLIRKWVFTLDSADDQADLVQRVAKGEADAIIELYNTYVNRIYISVYNQVDRNQQAAQDITQDIFIAAIGSAKNYNGKSAPNTWLYAIAHHKVADYYRRKKIHDRRFISRSEQLENILKSVKGPDDVESGSIQKLYLQAMLQNLPLHYRQVLLLKYIDRMSVSDIAAIMGKSIKSVEGILSRAKEALKQQLNELENLETV